MRARTPAELHTLFQQAVNVGDIALTCSDWSATATDQHGALVPMTGRGTEVARRQADGTWLLVIDNPWGTR